jgi:CheY-like chemotaxis protein
MSKRILVVEDQPDNRQIIRDMLAPTDYEITEAENGEEALAAIEKQRPDLILMDIQLPIMDGYTATRQIKADPALRSIPIIAGAQRRRKEGTSSRLRRLRAEAVQPSATTGENSSAPAKQLMGANAPFGDVRYPVAIRSKADTAAPT